MYKGIPRGVDNTTLGVESEISDEKAQLLYNFCSQPPDNDTSGNARILPKIPGFIREMLRGVLFTKDMWARAAASRGDAKKVLEELAEQRTVQRSADVAPNREEEKRLSNNKYKEKIAEAIAGGINNYFESKKKIVKRITSDKI